MTKPIVSKDFNLEDIRKIREYNSLHHALSFLPISSGRSFARSLHMVSAYWGCLCLQGMISPVFIWNRLNEFHRTLKKLKKK